jgi:hypothetical protein
MHLDPLVYGRCAMCWRNPILLVFASLQVLDRHMIVLVADVQSLSLVLQRRTVDRDNQRSPAPVVVIQSQNWGLAVRRPVQREIPWRLIDAWRLRIAARPEYHEWNQAEREKDAAILPWSIDEMAHIQKSPLFKVMEKVNAF